MPLPSSSVFQICPNLSPLFSRNIPRSLLDPSKVDHVVLTQFSQHFPIVFQIIPIFIPVPYFFVVFSFGCPTSFPIFSHNFPKSFPILCPPIHIVPNVFPLFSQIVLGLDHMSSLEPGSCRQKKKTHPIFFSNETLGSPHLILCFPLQRHSWV